MHFLTFWEEELTSEDLNKISSFFNFDSLKKQNPLTRSVSLNNTNPLFVLTVVEFAVVTVFNMSAGCRDTVQ